MSIFYVPGNILDAEDTTGNTICIEPPDWREDKQMVTDSQEHWEGGGQGSGNSPRKHCIIEV